MEQYSAAWRDVVSALRNRELWLALAGWDVRRMYRRSVLGPFWLTISSAVLIGGIGFLYGGMLNQPLAVYLPHVACGFVAWHYVAGTLQAGTNALIHEGAILKQVAIGPMSVVLRVLWRQLLVVSHQLVVPVVVLAVLGIWPGLDALWVFPGAALLVINLVWMSTALAIASARFRDIPPIVGSVLQIAFFLTPVIWLRDRLPTHFWLLDLNPFSHLIDIVRAPLVGAGVPVLSLVYCTVLAVLGSLTTFVLFANTRDRVVYWL